MIHEWLNNRRIRKLKSQIDSLPSAKFSTKALTSVVILSMNRTKDIQMCINSLYECTSLPFEVIIFDNGSTDKSTIEYLKSINGNTKSDGNGKIKVIFNKTNLGCSGGRKQALKFASGKYIATIDNDIIFTKNWLEHLIKRVESDKKIAAACVKLIYPDGRIQLNGGKMLVEDGYFVYFKTIQGSMMRDKKGISWSDPSSNKKRVCDWLPGGAMLMKKAVVKKVEHDDNFKNCFEDYDYSIQIKKKGYKLVNCPQSILIHNHIILRPHLREKERTYLKDRWSHVTYFESLLYFLHKNNLNLIKDSIFYDSDWHKEVLASKKLPVLEKRYKELSDKEIKEHFSKMLSTAGARPFLKASG
jgi:GT2 family glycosyltransferase